MITGYKKKKLGHPSEKLSGDLPRATWHAVLFSEVIFPAVMAILFVIAYMFVKSFPVDGEIPPSPLVRIAVISLGPIVWNAAILLVLFIFSIFLGPMLDPVVPMFGSVMAFIAHFLGSLGMVGFFEFLVCSTFFPLWSKLNISIVVLGTLGHISCRLGANRLRGYPACGAQNSHLGVLVP